MIIQAPFVQGKARGAGQIIGSVVVDSGGGGGGEITTLK